MMIFYYTSIKKYLSTSRLSFLKNKSGADDKHSNSKIKYRYLWYSNVQRNYFCLNFATYKYN